MWQRQLKQHMTRRYPMKIHKANWFQKGFSRWVAKRNEAGKEICRHVRHPWWTNPVFVGYLIPIQGAENPVELSNNLGFPSYDSSACIIFSGYICKDIAILYTSGPTMTWHTRFYCLKWKLRVVTMAHFSMILAHSARLKRHEGTNAEFHTRNKWWNKQQNFTRNYIQYHDFTSGSEASEKKHQLVKLMNGATVAETNSPIQ